MGRLGQYPTRSRHNPVLFGMTSDGGIADYDVQLRVSYSHAFPGGVKPLLTGRHQFAHFRVTQIVDITQFQIALIAETILELK